MNTRSLFRAAAAAGCLMLASTLAAELPPEVEKLVAAAEATQQRMKAVSYSFARSGHIIDEEAPPPVFKVSCEGRVERHGEWTVVDARWKRQHLEEGATDESINLRLIGSSTCLAWGEFPKEVPPNPYRISVGDDFSEKWSWARSIASLYLVDIASCSAISYSHRVDTRSILEGLVERGGTLALSSPDEHGLVHLTATESEGGIVRLDAAFDPGRGYVVPKVIQYRADGDPSVEIDRTFKELEGAWVLATEERVNYSAAAPKGEITPFMRSTVRVTPLSLGDTAPVEPFQWLCEGRDVTFTVVDSKNQPIGEAPCHDGRISIGGVEYP